MKTQIHPYVHCFPAPAILIGCGTVEKPNLITCSWFGTVCSEPPQVSVSIRENRFSFPLVSESGEFTANIPKISNLEWVEYCGTKSGRETNKFTDLGLTAVPCPPLKTAPMIEECPITLACRVKHELSLGVRKDGKADPFPEEQIVYLNKKYWIPRPAE